MKKIALLFLMVSLGSSLFAQKGKITLGVDYHKMDNPYVYNSLVYPYGYYGPTYSFEPKVGYFISDNVELGLGFKSGDDELSDLDYTRIIGSNYTRIIGSEFGGIPQNFRACGGQIQCISPCIKDLIPNIFAPVAGKSNAFPPV